MFASDVRRYSQTFNDFLANIARNETRWRFFGKYVKFTQIIYIPVTQCLCFSTSFAINRSKLFSQTSMETRRFSLILGEKKKKLFRTRLAISRYGIFNAIQRGRELKPFGCTNALMERRLTLTSSARYEIYRAAWLYVIKKLIRYFLLRVRPLFSKLASWTEAWSRFFAWSRAISWNRVRWAGCNNGAARTGDRASSSATRSRYRGK